MPPTSATTRYKKKDGKDGTLAFPTSKDFVYWTPKEPPSSTPAVTIPIKDIVNLQATPATAKSAALKLILADITHTFYFPASGGKEWDDLQSLKEPITSAIADLKKETAPLASGSGTPARNGAAGGQSAAMAIAKAMASKAEEQWYDDAKLMEDKALQASLFKSDPVLEARFKQAMRDKPETVTMSQFTSQFWGTRLHLLRAHAVEREQKAGEFNVLPMIKHHDVPPPADNPEVGWTKALKIDKEQIRMLFRHYPLLLTAYNELTPRPEKPLTEGNFWERFFQTGGRLRKKLKGERILDTDIRDQYLDKYLEYDLEAPTKSKPLQGSQIPNWMNLEGNEQDLSQRGNRPDSELRPQNINKVPVLRILNNLSERLMAHIQPEDSEAHGPIGMDEETFDQLKLQDLAREDIDNRVVLNIKEQQRYVGGNVDDLSAEAKLYARQDPNKVLSTLRSDLEPSSLGADEQGTLRLDRAIGYQTEDESDSEDEDASEQTNGTAPKKKKATVRVGSHAAMASASADIAYSIKRRRLADSANANSLNGLSQATFDQLTMTHNTTTEFLHYFWSLFLSGDASRATELEKLVASLDNSMNRINAVAVTAEEERQKIVDGIKEDDRIYFERTKKRRKTSRYDLVPGGKTAVMEMVKPTVDALRRAEQEYRRVYEEQTREAHTTAG